MLSSIPEPLDSCYTNRMNISQSRVSMKRLHDNETPIRVKTQRKEVARNILYHARPEDSLIQLRNMSRSCITSPSVRPSLNPPMQERRRHELPFARWVGLPRALRPPAAVRGSEQRSPHHRRRTSYHFSSLAFPFLLSFFRRRPEDFSLTSSSWYALACSMNLGRTIQEQLSPLHRSLHSGLKLSNTPFVRSSAS